MDFSDPNLWNDSLLSLIAMIRQTYRQPNRVSQVTYNNIDGANAELCFTLLFLPSKHRSALYHASSNIR